MDILVFTAILMIWSSNKTTPVINNGRFMICRKFFNPCVLLFVLFPVLASMLSVAWGTAIKRSFWMSLPVSRQMP